MQPDAEALALNMRRLRLRHLEVLLAVARDGSITAAAEALGATQPAVSQWLGEVEAAMGVPLFTRGRQIRPTAYLPAALRHARRTVADSYRLQREFDAVAAGTAGSVRIGTMLVSAAGLVPQALLRLKAGQELLQLQVVEDIASGLWARFERHELDVIVGRLDERAFRAGVRREALFADTHALVVAPAHPLARLRRPGWAQIMAFPWVLPPPETSLRRAIDATLLEQGLPPPAPWLESASPTVTEEVLRQTQCVGVLSGAAAARARRLRTLAMLPMHLASDIGPVGMVWDERESSPALDAVLQALRDCAGQG